MFVKIFNIFKIFLAMFDNMWKGEEVPLTILASAGRNGKENESLQGATHWSQEFKKKVKVKLQEQYESENKIARVT